MTTRRIGALDSDVEDDDPPSYEENEMDEASDGRRRRNYAEQKRISVTGDDAE